MILGGQSILEKVHLDLVYPRDETEIVLKPLDNMLLQTIPVTFTFEYKNIKCLSFFRFIRESPLPLLRRIIELGSYLAGSAATLCTRLPLAGEK